MSKREDRGGFNRDRSLEREATTAAVTIQDKPAGLESSNGLWQPATLAEARRRTAHLAKRHYENFVVSSVLLPPRMRQPFYDLYAFCRTADDAADESGSPQIARQRLEQLRHELDEMFAGRVTKALFVALNETVQQFDLRSEPMHDLIDAFLQDQTQTRYRDDDELLRYCQRSANPVGRMVLRLGDCDDSTNVAASDSICTGLQLINFWQDVRRDLAIDRIYIPQSRLTEHGVREADLRSGTSDESTRGLIRELCEWARSHFETRDRLAADVPSWLASSIRLFADGGLATCDAIERQNYDVLRCRPKVGKTTQMRLVAREWWRSRFAD